jgi:hypothetical protein
MNNFEMGKNPQSTGRVQFGINLFLGKTLSGL